MSSRYLGKIHKVADARQYCGMIKIASNILIREECVWKNLLMFSIATEILICLMPLGFTERSRANGCGLQQIRLRFPRKKRKKVADKKLVAKRRCQKLRKKRTEIRSVAEISRIGVFDA